jgi:hypothetical protein
LSEFPGKPVRAFVVWEPVLATDWARPSTAALARIPDPRAAQFWDKDRLVSHSWGEHSRQTIVWDDISIYPPGALWQESQPTPLYRGRTVVKVEDRARAALAQALQEVRQAP